MKYFLDPDIIPLLSVVRFGKGKKKQEGVITNQVVDRNSEGFHVSYSVGSFGWFTYGELEVVRKATDEDLNKLLKGG